MTDWKRLLRSSWPWRRRVAPVPTDTRTIPLERTAPRVPAEYLSLYAYLERRYASIVVLTFEQMEALLGSALPTPAYTDKDWWTRAAVAGQGQSAAWLGAGRTAAPNILAKTVTFERA